MRTYILYTRRREAAQKEIRDLDGKITQQFTRDLFMAVLPDSFDVRKLKYSRTRFPANLSKTSKLVLKAWRLGQKKAEKYISIVDPNRDLLWGSPGLETPLNQELVRTMIAPVELPTLPPLTSRQMTGSVAVGIIIVSGPGSNLRFTERQKAKVISEVRDGLDFLERLEPKANLFFDHEIHAIDVAAIPGPTTRLETAEAPWRDEALGQMGFARSSDFVSDLRHRKQTDWAYVAFFTKYTLKDPYYTVGERVLMQYKVDDRIADNLNTVFAHETCHVFGASDEYDPCSCTKKYGILQVANENCRTCAANFEYCLMGSSSKDMCRFTRQQIGWDGSWYP
jgi:hypothetical protein